MARCAGGVKMSSVPNSLCVLCVNNSRFLVRAENAELMIAVAEKVSKTIS